MAMAALAALFQRSCLSACCVLVLQVLCNISLNVNSVGFYQIMKIAITPTILILEFFMFRKVRGGSYTGRLDTHCWAG